MKPLPLALLALLVVATTASADVPPAAFNTDPGFSQVYWASKAAVPFAFVAIALALVWLHWHPGRTNGNVVGVFLVLVVGTTIYWGIELAAGGGAAANSPVTLVDEAAPANRPWLHYRHAPEKLREVSAGESLILGVLASALVCFGGLAVFRRLSRPAPSPAAQEPDSPSDFSKR